MALTPKQALFVQEYLVDLNATQAAIRAGYSAKTARAVGHENLKKPDIAEAIAEAQAERAEKVKIDAEYVLRQAVKLHERCMQEIEPFTDRKGDQIYDEKGNPLFVFNANGAAKALELVGKHVAVAAFKEGATNVNITLPPPPEYKIVDQ
jgi:phage terminase small subunit